MSLKKYGKVVSFCIGLNLKDTVTQGALLFTLPVGFRPSHKITVSLTDINGYSQPICVEIHTDGNFYIGIFASSTPFQNTWFYMNVTFITD